MSLSLKKRAGAHVAAVVPAFNVAGELGTVLRLDRLTEAPQHVAALLRGSAAFRVRTAALREEWVFNFGRSVELGAREIARMADERAGVGASGTPR